MDSQAMQHLQVICPAKNIYPVEKEDYKEKRRMDLEPVSWIFPNAPVRSNRCYRRGPTRRSQKCLVFPTPKSGAAVSSKIASGNGFD